MKFHLCTQLPFFSTVHNREFQKPDKVTDSVANLSVKQVMDEEIAE